MKKNSKPSVLVVDDEPSILALISVILERNGIRALLARSASEAVQIAMLGHVPIDLVLTDVSMPEVGGQELVAHLQTQRRDLRALYMSAFNEGDVLRVELMKSGAGFVSKPFDNSELVATVRQAIAAPRVQTASARSAN